MRCRARRARTAWLTHRGRLAQMSEVTLLTYGGADDFGEFIVFYQDGRRHQVRSIQRRRDARASLTLFDLTASSDQN